LDACFKSSIDEEANEPAESLHDLRFVLVVADLCFDEQTEVSDDNKVSQSHDKSYGCSTNVNSVQNSPSAFEKKKERTCKETNGYCNTALGKQKQNNQNMK
jgi:hypothetical protein